MTKTDIRPIYIKTTKGKKAHQIELKTENIKIKAKYL